MKKGVEIAFAIALFLLAIISTIWPNGLMGNIIYAVVIPSFILSVISLVSDLAEMCEKYAETIANSEKELSDKTNELAELKLKNYKNGVHGQVYIEGMIPVDVYQCRERSLEYINKALVTKDVQIFCVHCKDVCSYITVVGYVLLFLSLSLSPYIAAWLSAIDLNCITLWSLALLYVSLELKVEMREWLFRFLHKRFAKKAEAKTQPNENPTDE